MVTAMVGSAELGIAASDTDSPFACIGRALLGCRVVAPLQEHTYHRRDFNG
jgi:hypothetical protein